MSKKDKKTDETVETVETVDTVDTVDTVETDETTMDAEALIATLQEENAMLNESVEKLKNDYYKAYADAENSKKRIEREYEVSMKYRAQSFAFSILPAIDNLERALSQEVDESAKMYRDGVQLIYDQIVEALKKEGVEPIEALNKVFDPNIHQALLVEEKEGYESNIVIEELQKGYMIKDRVLRASLVKVSQ